MSKTIEGEVLDRGYRCHPIYKYYLEKGIKVVKQGKKKNSCRRERRKSKGKKRVDTL